MLEEQQGPNAFSVGPGPVRNDSAAERHLEYQINIPHARRYNESVKESRTAIIVMIVITLGLIAFGAYLLSSSSTGVLVLGGLTALLGIAGLVFAGYAATQLDPKGFLDRGVLNPAIVCGAEKGYIWLLTLGEIGPSDTVWALFATKVADLPGHLNTVGERIPVTCCFAGIEGDRYKTIYVSPIAWGTDSAQVLQGAAQSIDEKEWQLLESMRSRFVSDGDYSIMEAKGIQILTQVEVAGVSATENPELEATTY